MATTYYRGHKIFFDGWNWRYCDTWEIISNRPCKRCNRPPTHEGYDACLGHIPGMFSACCGHGVSKGYRLKGKQGKRKEVG